MDKMLLLSVILVNVWMAGKAGMSANPRRSLARLFVASAAYNMFYLFLIMYVWPRILTDSG